jgi:putative aldouronate transport system substrate-binding protein
MNRSARTLLLLLLGLGVAVGGLFASGGEEQAAGGKPYPLTFFLTGDMAGKPLKPDDRIVAELNKRLGIELIVKAVPQLAWDKVTVAIASGDLPDLVNINYPSVAASQWVKDGILVPFNDYFAFMPTEKKRIDTIYPWSAEDGKYYFHLFAIEPIANSNIMYRTDWLAKLKKQPPRTLEEFEALMKDFTFKDPDGNGKDDTYGWTGNKPIGDWTFVFFAAGRPYADYWIDANGKLAPLHEHPSFAEGMKFIKRLWEAKVIETEYFLNDYTMLEQKFAQGKAGCITAALFRNLNRVETMVKNVTPTGGLTYADPPAGPTGKRGNGGVPKSGIAAAITTGSKNPKKAAQFLEYLISKEGRDLLQLGLEGIHYTKGADGKIVYNEAERAKENFAPNGWSHPLAWGNVVWPLQAGYLPDTEPQKERAIDSMVVASRNMVPNLVPVPVPAEIEYGPRASDPYNQLFIDMMMGKVDIAQGIAGYSKSWREQGGDKILANAEALYKQYKK